VVSVYLYPKTADEYSGTYLSVPGGFAQPGTLVLRLFDFLHPLLHPKWRTRNRNPFPLSLRDHSLDPRELRLIIVAWPRHYDLNQETEHEGDVFNLRIRSKKAARLEELQGRQCGVADQMEGVLNPNAIIRHEPRSVAGQEVGEALDMLPEDDWVL
jgi:hypothetical protein